MAKFMVVPKGLNVRSGPGVSYDPPLAVLAHGDVIEEVAVVGWTPMAMSNGKVGWVSRAYLQVAPDDVPPVLVGITGQAIVEKALTQAGDPYIFGYEVDLQDPDPDAFDCSELVQWVCAQLGVIPKMPDGAVYQYEHCQTYPTLITLEKAVKTAGALLFRITPEGNNHVAISMGNGITIEARGKAYGVGSWSASGRPWTAAGLIPGVKYV